jgi:Kef-type K+ transport system membrane component KefB
VSACRALAYATTAAAAVALFLLIDAQGRRLAGPPAAPAETRAGAGAGKSEALMHVLLALTAVIVAGLVMGRVCRWIGQPRVIGEVLAGIMLGPSLLGRLAPDAFDFLLPSSAAPSLGLVAQLGVILYMFLLGLELNLGALRARAGTTASIAFSSILVPFVLGAGLALPLYTRLATPDVPFTSFALFLGVATSVTAFPVLARILTDRGMQKTELGVVALSCAAMNDVAAWCLLALVVGVAQTQFDRALAVLGGTLAFVAVMLLVVRPLAVRVVAKAEENESARGVVTLVFVALLASALTAEWIGIHAIFGAFLLGVVIPHDSAVAKAFISRLEDLVTIVFLPAFFAFTGLRTQIGFVSTGEEWLLCGLIVLVATVGKIGGTFAAARLNGMTARRSAELGALMNTRGLMELIVLNIGLDLKIISPKLFAMMVIMAVATTMMTAPLLNLLERWRSEPATEPEEAAAVVT